jgi:hypothetical protein
MLSADETAGAGELETSAIIDAAPRAVREDGAASPFGERRRPGRPNHAAATLIPLLRDASTAELELALQANGEHGLAPATGIVVSVLLSCLIWALLVLAY